MFYAGGIRRRGAFWGDWVFTADCTVLSPIGFFRFAPGVVGLAVFYRLDGVFLTAFFCLDGVL